MILLYIYSHERTTDELKQMCLQLYNQTVGMKMNMTITKMMFNNYIPNHEIKDDKVIECVKK